MATFFWKALWAFWPSLDNYKGSQFWTEDSQSWKIKIICVLVCSQVFFGCVVGGIMRFAILVAQQ